jgi:YHYH protein
MRNAILIALSCASLAIACSSPTSPDTASTTTGTTTTTTSGGTSATALYTKFQSAVTVTMDGSTVVLRSNGTPDHTSPYWGSGNAMYETPQAGMQVNPNLIVAQSFVVRVPSTPAVGTSSDTPLGAMGMAVNGVAIFNQYAAGRTPLTSEIFSFDRFNGHPQQSGTYHYHMEPLWLTSNRGASSLIGVLLDGFPVYGPREENGSTPSGLDTCNGHTHATADIPGGIYHYHVTSATPYISGCFRGTPGTVG